MNKRHRSYCFTWNNYTVENIDTLTQSFIEIGAKKYIFQEEIGEENNVPHLQGVVCFRNPIWFNTLKRIDSRVHWEACRDLKGSIKYCSKTKTRKNGTNPYRYNVSDRETCSSKMKRKISEAAAMEDMHRFMVEDVQKKADDRSEQWNKQWEYQKEWYLEMQKLFEKHETIE